MDNTQTGISNLNSTHISAQKPQEKRTANLLTISLLTILISTLISTLFISDNLLFILPTLIELGAYICAPSLLILHLSTLRSDNKTIKPLTLDILVLTTLILVTWRFASLQDIQLTSFHSLILLIDFALLLFYRLKSDDRRIYIGLITLLSLILTIRAFGLYQVLNHPTKVNLLLDDWVIPSLKVNNLNKYSHLGNGVNPCDSSITHPKVSVTQRNFHLLKLKNSTLCNIDFSHSKMLKATISHANLLASFHVADLSDATIEHSVFLPNSSFIGANLKKATINQSIANEVEFSLAKMLHTRIAHSQFLNSQFLQTSLISSHVNDTDFSQVNFVKADLSNTKFNKTLLVNNDLRSAIGLNDYYFMPQESLHPNAEPNIVKHCLLGNSRFRFLSDKEEMLRESGCLIASTEIDKAHELNWTSTQRLAEKLIEAHLIAPRKTLDLTRLNLTQLPKSAYQLTQVSELILNNNPISEQGLEQIILNFPNLSSLSLMSTDIEKIPESIEKLTRLQFLDLSYNNLTELPESLTQLRQLKRLYLDQNQLTALPLSIGNLSNLEFLRANHNQIVKLPSSTSQLTHLHWLHLNHNQIIQLPEDIGALSHLYDLQLSDNPLASLPLSTKELVELINLCTHNTSIKELPAGFDVKLGDHCSMSAARAKSKS